mgnify:CR=1 FL=1
MSWSTAREIKAQLLRLWERGELLRDLLSGEARFPLRQSVKGPTSAEITDRFEAVRLWAAELADLPPLRVEWRDVGHRVHGAQRLPACIWIDSADDALAWLGKRRERDRFADLIATTRGQCPDVLPWLEKRPLQALTLAGDWPQLLAVVNWVAAHPQPGIYLRQVDIPGVHSKFIETHRAVLAELLDLALPVDAVDVGKTGVGQFAARYGFRDKPLRIRLRVLDPDIRVFAGLACPDVTLDADSFGRLALDVTRVIITENETNFLAAVSPNVSSSGQLIAGNNNYPSSVSGVGTDYLEIRQLSVENGEMFTEADIQTSAKVCVIGKTIQDNLFPGGEDPVGRIIRFNQVPFRVVGVLKSKGYNSMGMDQDDVVLAPYSTVMKRLLAQTYLSGIFASALTEDMTDNATDEITEILRRNHKLKESDDDDFTIRSQQELSTMLNSTTDLMTTLLACIAGISLVVGGIGIMNIMYVSVTERTREIGLRMSVGARGVDILSQFLIEAILISITGGIIGVIIGCGASWIVKSVAHWPIFIQPWSVFLSFAVCTVTGVFFGWYPAKKAADLDPIEAIRYE